jgi:23S rRNA (uracil1939-C5)-methyltransferase
LPIFNRDEKEVTPPCPYFGDCGGCHLQHLHYDSQLRWKDNLILKTLGDLAPSEKLRPILPSPKVWHYRRRIQVHATPSGQPGFYAAGSHRVVPIAECLIADPALNNALKKLPDAWSQEFDKRTRPSLITSELTCEPDGKVRILSGGEGRFFLQVNEGANRRLIKFLDSVLRELEPRRVLELYAGAGNLTYSLWQKGREWTAVEWDSLAFEKGKGINISPQIRWVHEKAERYLKKHRDAVDLILMDPPRSGAKECLPFLIRRPPPALLYLSCALNVLAQDLKQLLSGGFKINWVQPFDFFPHTRHVECLASLTP